MTQLDWSEKEEVECMRCGVSGLLMLVGLQRVYGAVVRRVVFIGLSPLNRNEP